MTKNTIDENIIKYPSSAIDNPEIVRIPTQVIENPTVKIYGEQTLKTKTLRIKPKTKSLPFKIRLYKLMIKLYNMEPENEREDLTEKTAKIDLENLYQMENF